MASTSNNSFSFLFFDSILHSISISIVIYLNNLFRKLFQSQSNNVKLSQRSTNVKIINQNFLNSIRVILSNQIKNKFLLSFIYLNAKFVVKNVFIEESHLIHSKTAMDFPAAPDRDRAGEPISGG